MGGVEAPQVHVLLRACGSFARQVVCKTRRKSVGFMWKCCVADGRKRGGPTRGVRRWLQNDPLHVEWLIFCFAAISSFAVKEGFRRNSV